MKITKIVFLDDSGSEVTKEVTDGIALLYNEQTKEVLVQDSDVLKLNLICFKRLLKKINNSIEDF